MATLQTIIGISLLIILHEAGHYLVARWSGMRVLRFSVGFGPALFKRKVGETVWQIAAIPLGGFVQIDGMGPQLDEKGEPIPRDQIKVDPRSYLSRPLYQRILVIFAGPAANWLIAALCIMVALAAGYGRPDGSNRLGHIIEGHPAAAAGLQEGDRVLRVGETEVSDWETLVAAIEANPETTVDFTVERGGEELSLAVTPRRDGEVGRIGVEPHVEIIRQPVWEAALGGFYHAARMTAEQASLLWGLVTGSAAGRLAGLPGIVKMVSQQAERGIGRLMQSLAWLSIGLCLLNLAPLPALDGGRLLFLFIETIRGKRVDERIEGVVHAVGFILLLSLLIFVSVRDLM